MATHTTHQQHPKHSGWFITFEGIDGSGKSTQLKLLAERLTNDGHHVVVTRNPGGTELGTEVRKILLHHDKPVDPTCELLLFMADRAQHMAQLVRTTLKTGGIVLCDRHIDSTLAYQGYGRNLDHAMINNLNALATQHQPPDLTLLFDGAPETLLKRVHQRGEADRLEQEKLDFYQRTAEGYRAIAKANPQRVVVFDALESIDTLQAQVYRHINQQLNAHRLA